MKKNNTAVLFIADPLSQFNPQAETTFFLMAECERRGWEVVHTTLDGLYYQNGEVLVRGTTLSLKRQRHAFSYQILGERVRVAKNFNVIFVRKDPPVNQAYMDHLSLLELIQDDTLILNRPSSIKSANEKLFTLHFKKWVPESIVSRSHSEIQNFIHKHDKVVLKPLHLSGGRGIVLIERDHPSLLSVLDYATQNESSYIMVQRYIPEAKKGDKRILLWNGTVLGTFLRVPGKKDFRGNLHSGASLQKAPLTKSDQELVNDVAPLLQKMGLAFVGLDVLGDRLTEINTTSPMGINEINLLTNSHCERIIGESLTKALK